VAAGDDENPFIAPVTEISTHTSALPDTDDGGTRTPDIFHVKREPICAVLVARKPGMAGEWHERNSKVKRSVSLLPLSNDEMTK
jgi:hypothetical protein